MPFGPGAAPFRLRRNTSAISCFVGGFSKRGNWEEVSSFQVKGQSDPVFRHGTVSQNSPQQLAPKMWAANGLLLKQILPELHRILLELSLLMEVAKGRFTFPGAPSEAVVFMHHIKPFFRDEGVGGGFLMTISMEKFPTLSQFLL